jgi:hypothetical protein
MQTSAEDAHDSEGRALKNWALLALPWLAAQRDMLAACKSYIKDEKCTLPMQNFALRELQALMMVFDPSRKWREASSDLESGIGDVYKDSMPKLVSGSVALIEAQEAVVASMMDALTRMKNGPGKTKPDGS